MCIGLRTKTEVFYKKNVVCSDYDIIGIIWFEIWVPIEQGEMDDIYVCSLYIPRN